MTLVDWGPAAQMAAIGGSLAAGFAGLMAWRQCGRQDRDGLRRLTWLLLFLTFDLIVFGAFTRLSDSGLGCPDWPGCYGQASPLGARADIAAAEAVQPTGPVTRAKAWIEMIHRYLATAVGALILAMLVGHLRRARQGRRSADPDSTQAWPAWTALIFLWVCAQGAFGALTVTMKLYPAIVTLHLLGGVGLLGLIAVLARRQTPGARALPAPLRRAARAGLVLLLLQVALGGWVSTNYAVLACQDFPTCQGQWWPPMDLATGFEWRRELGQTGDGAFLPFAALTAIHVVHRVGALVVLVALGGLAGWLYRQGRTRAAAALAGLLAWQVASGVSNVVLDWPLAAALAHTAGAAALVALLSALSTLRAVMPGDSQAGMLGRR
ncbi:MAG: COX15/CtaA family protein [Burkholderiaceae bacterium]|nr:COX15/CtaA family protein [Burkholderiaceae bacterium]